MNWSDLPSLNSLRAFSAVADAKSYSRAAQKLNVTHAAVNQQVKGLEARLGVPLVVRKGRGIVLTPMGTSLARDLGIGFEAIRRGVDALSGADASRPVQITMSPAFAVEWLMPRITEFQQRHPDILLMLNPSAEVIDLVPGGVDLAIRYTDQRRLKKGVTPILVSDMVVVGAPQIAGDLDTRDPAALVGLPWLQELGTQETTDWFARRGVKFDHPHMVTQMPGNLIMQAVRRGDGVTYTVRAFFDQEIRSGSMQLLHTEPMFGTFYLETVPGTVRPAVKLVMDWLEEKAETITA